MLKRKRSNGDFDCLLKQVREESRSEKLPALLPITESAGGYDIVFAGSPKMEHGYICV